MEVLYQGDFTQGCFNMGPSSYMFAYHLSSYGWFFSLLFRILPEILFRNVPGKIYFQGPHQ